MTATEIVRPDVPISSGMPRTDSTSVIGFHVGRARRQQDVPQHRVGEDDEWLRTEAVDLGMNYLLIPGDVVDGIGIYPDQEQSWM